MNDQRGVLFVPYKDTLGLLSVADAMRVCEQVYLMHARSSVVLSNPPSFKLDVADGFHNHWHVKSVFLKDIPATGVRVYNYFDDGVRNNAIRALVVLARSSAEASAIIPGECFVGLLNSGIWTDRNKSAELLAVLTRQRNPRLITCLRKEALTSLVEMARWSYPGHADSARLMLGRIGGIKEKTLIGMLERQEVEPIINALTTQKNNASRSCPVCAALK